MAVKGKLAREELVAALIKRDGLECGYPGCKERIDVSVTEGPLEATIDHTIPQWYGRENGWSQDQIWALTNLTLMHKKCNAKKGDLIPNEDGSLPVKISKFRYRRDKRAERPEICTSCSAGRDLGPDEMCASCGSGPQPERFPRWAKVSSSECDHEVFWCAWCSIGVIPRAGATEMIMLYGEGGEE